MGFYKFTASNAPISQSNYIRTKLKPGKKVNITTQDTQSPDLVTVKLEGKV